MNATTTLDGVNLLPLFDRQLVARGKAFPSVPQFNRPGVPERKKQTDR